MVAACPKPRREAMTGRDVLAPACDLRVARLAADGLTKSKVRARAVHHHQDGDRTPSTAFSKLEITRREELADALTAVIDDGAEESRARRDGDFLEPIAPKD
jgi:hypothetical protein